MALKEVMCAVLQRKAHNVYTLAANASTIFAGTYNDGLSNTNVLSLTAFNGYLYAGTCGSGVWKRPLTELVGLQEFTSTGSYQTGISKAGKSRRGIRELRNAGIISLLPVVFSWKQPGSEGLGISVSFPPNPSPFHC